MRGDSFVYILLQQNNRIFVPKESRSKDVLVTCDYGVTDDIIAGWVQNCFGVAVLNVLINEESKNLAIVIIDGHEKCSKEELLTFPTALKCLPHNAVGQAAKKYIEQQQARYSVKLQYGLRDGKIIIIDEISESEKGLKCQCKCPGCGMELQAKLGGGKRQRHFAHNNTTCDIVVAQQSALHMLAKEIIEQEGSILLPPLEVCFRDIPNMHMEYDYCYNLPDKLVFKPQKLVHCDEVFLEQRLSDIIPDVIIKASGKMCLVEIAVTHFIDDEKAKKIKQLGLAVVEIDLSALQKKELNRALIRNILVEQIDGKSWAYNPLSEKAISWASTQYSKLYQAQRQKEMESMKALKIREQQRQNKREQAQIRIKELFVPENYRAALILLRDDEKCYSQWKKRSFFQKNLEIPFYMDIPITGEMVFDCDHRIWQSAIFDQFVYNRKQKSNEPTTIHISKIEKWVTTFQHDFKINWDLVPKTYLMIKNHGYSRSLLYESIKQYLDYLSNLGFISEVYYQEAEVLCSHCIIPPNTAKAVELKAILESVDRESCDINDRIEVMLHPQRVFIRPQIDSPLYDDEWGKKYEMQNQKVRDQQLAASRTIKYEAGLAEVMSSNILTGEGLAKDSFGFRWLICSVCGQIKREDEMASYSGKIGTCKECSRI